MYSVVPRCRLVACAVVGTHLAMRVPVVELAAPLRRVDIQAVDLAWNIYICGIMRCGLTDFIDAKYEEGLLAAEHLPKRQS
jgi:hypothetical protein